MTARALETRADVVRLRQEAANDTAAAARWEYWATLGRIRNLGRHGVGLPWPEIAELLGLDPETDRKLGGMHQGDRRVRVVAELLRSPED